MTVNYSVRYKKPYVLYDDVNFLRSCVLRYQTTVVEIVIDGPTPHLKTSYPVLLPSPYRWAFNVYLRYMYFKLYTWAAQYRVVMPISNDAVPLCQAVFDTLVKPTYVLYLIGTMKTKLSSFGIKTTPKVNYLK